MQQEIRFATFNVCNLSQPGAKLYDNLAPLTEAEYQAKVAWTAQQLDQLDADVIGLQEIFSLDGAARRAGPQHSQLPRRHADWLSTPPPDPATGLPRVTPELALISRLPLAASGPGLHHVSGWRGAARRPPRRRPLRPCAAACAGGAAG